MKKNKNQLSKDNSKKNIQSSFRIFNNNSVNNKLNIDNCNKKYEEILKCNDKELNSLIYKQAIISDERTFLQYYFSLLKINHLFIFSFYSKNNDYNSQIIKIFLFFFFLALHFTVNALFFNEDTLHEIYIDEGEFDFVYQIPQIICSSIISAIISKIIRYFSLSENNIIQLKNETKIGLLNTKVKELKRTLKIKFACFFVIAFFLLLFFAYYIICFCGIYINTQLHLIKDTLISFGLSLIYPFGIYLIPGIFRIPALRDKKKDCEYLYKFSKLIQNV